MQVNKKCECETCWECMGSGEIWVSWSGEYLGRNRCDDFDELETCPECGGEGITSLCLKCRLEYEQFEYEVEQERRYECWRGY